MIFRLIYKMIYMNINIQNIIINYNINKKLEILNELLSSTLFIKSFLDEECNFPNSKIIRIKYKNNYNWDILPVLTRRSKI